MKIQFSCARSWSASGPQNQDKDAIRGNASKSTNSMLVNFVRCSSQNEKKIGIFQYQRKILAMPKVGRLSNADSSNYYSCMLNPSNGLQNQQKLHRTLGYHGNFHLFNQKTRIPVAEVKQKWRNRQIAHQQKVMEPQKASLQSWFCFFWIPTWNSEHQKLVGHMLRSGGSNGLAPF